MHGSFAAVDMMDLISKHNNKTILFNNRATFYFAFTVEKPHF